MMKRLLMSAAIAALAVPAFAQDTATPETAAEESAQTAEEAAGDAADAAGEAADATADAASDAADATADAASDAADATADAAADAGDAAEAEMTAEGEAMDENADEMAEEDAGEEAVEAPTDAQPELDSANPSMLASWVEGLQVFTTNEPSGSEWSALEGDAIPEGWDDIADIGDIVINSEHQVVGYVIDIGGFLGIGAKEVLVSTEAAQMGTFGDQTIFVTNYTKEELGALPDFDDSMMMPSVLNGEEGDMAADPATADPNAEPAEGEAAPAN